MTTQDYSTIQAMRAHGGSFVRALAEAAQRADSENLRRIQLCWPEVWEHYRRWALDDQAAREELNETALFACAFLDSVPASKPVTQHHDCTCNS